MIGVNVQNADARARTQVSELTQKTELKRVGGMQRKNIQSGKR